MEKLILGAFIALPVVYLLHRYFEARHTRHQQEENLWEARQLINHPRKPRLDD